MIETFEDLEVWRVCRELRRDLSALIRRFPPEERFRLVDQILRASRSVTNNIAEGFGRYHFQENIRFCRQSRGSLYELMDHLSVAYDEGYIEESEFGAYRLRILEAIKLLNGYIRYLRARKSSLEARRANQQITNQRVTNNEVNHALPQEA